MGAMEAVQGNSGSPCRWRNCLDVLAIRSCSSHSWQISTWCVFDSRYSHDDKWIDWSDDMTDYKSIFKREDHIKQFHLHAKDRKGVFLGKESSSNKFTKEWKVNKQAIINRPRGLAKKQRPITAIGLVKWKTKKKWKTNRQRLTYMLVTEGYKLNMIMDICI